MKIRKSKVPQGFLALAGLCGIFRWCRGTELNCRHGDFQSPALPTELPRLLGASAPLWMKMSCTRLPRLWQALFDKLAPSGASKKISSKISPYCHGRGKSSRGGIVLRARRIRARGWPRPGEMPWHPGGCRRARCHCVGPIAQENLNVARVPAILLSTLQHPQGAFSWPFTLLSPPPCEICRPCAPWASGSFCCRPCSPAASPAR